MEKTIFYALTVLFLSAVLIGYQSGDAVWGFSQENSGTPVSIYRFFNTERGGHLYTISTIEKDHIINNFPQWNYEGTKFRVYDYHAEGTAETYRFFNTITGIHLYTISDIERDYIINNLPEWNYEGVKFYVSESLADDTTAVYRFFNHVRGGHLYTISEIERDAVMQLPEWTYEGVPFYVYPQDIPLPRTGQTTIYMTGDDGYYQMGVPWPEPLFTDHGDGTVTHNLTGLMWTQNANMPDGELDWDSAVDWCNTLVHAGYSDWRLPNVRELYSIIDIEKYYPALPEGHSFTFNGVESYYYWSSSTFGNYSGDAWYVHTGAGYSWNISKTYSNYVWAVRGVSNGISPIPRTGQTISYLEGDDGYYQMGVPWPEPRFTDHGNGTITDNLTGLMWSQDANMGGTKIWNSAIGWCNNLVHAGYSDWRLPNIRELFSLMDLGRVNPGLPEGHPFSVEQYSVHWSSSTLFYYSGGAWVITMTYGHVAETLKSASYSAWPVRGGQ